MKLFHKNMFNSSPKENVKNIKDEKAKKQLPHELHEDIKPKKMTNEKLKMMVPYFPSQSRPLFL
ncbi:hypothetical protein KFK09_024495 [Dendrobium nobile]|uniref:Uncharacterized protein n=1 Tax=Dendrobium nobile TaxID=94219 RepID=A0A8T3AE55_DENNO|nr:hypothetical protein KFK09_024495 [Dendrobium nobile]